MFREFTIPEEVHRLLGTHLCAVCSIDAYKHPSPLRVEAARRMSDFLPFNIKSVLQDMFSGAGDNLVVLHNMPIDHKLPATPINASRPVGKGNMSEAVLLGLGMYMNMHPFAYEGEHQDLIVHQICPVPTKEKHISANGRVSFELHNEAPHLDHCPDYLILLCLRGDSNAVNAVADFNDMMRIIPQGSMDVLMQERFTIKSGHSFKHRVQKTTKVVYGDDTYGLCVRFHYHNMEGIDPEAVAALMHLKQAADEVSHKLVLTPGDVLIMNNKRSLHARTAFRPDYEGAQRWLQRVYLTRYFWRGPTIAGSEMLWKGY